MRIALGSDHAGFAMKESLRSHLTEGGHEVVDLGTHSSESCDYPDIAHALSTRVREGGAELGILVCGTGVGMSIAANKNAGVRAVVCSEPLSARMSREHNDANVLCVGARVVGEGTAIEMVEAFLGAKFEGGRHARRVAKIEPA